MVRIGRSHHDGRGRHGHLLRTRRRAPQGLRQVARAPGGGGLPAPAPRRRGGLRGRGPGQERPREAARVRRLAERERGTGRGAQGLRAGPPRSLQAPARGGLHGLPPPHASREGGPGEAPEGRAVKVELKPYFRAWEKLRIPYNLSLVVILIVTLIPSVAAMRGIFFQPLTLLSWLIGAVGANILFLAAPLAEAYLDWLGI